MICELSSVPKDVPEFIQGYRLLSALNRDETSSVFLTLDPISCHKLAVKLIFHNQPENKMKLRGLEILKSVKYPGILSPQDIIKTDDYTAIITTYAFSGDLFYYMMEHGTFDEYNAKRIMWSISNSVNCLHQVNIVHNQLRPESILFVNDEEEFLDPILGSFGSAMRLGDDMMFEPDEADPFVSQELAETHIATQASDIYSLGVTFYQMIMGRFPFEYIEEGHETYFDGEEWQKISDNLIDLLGGMLCDNPDERLTIGEILNHPFFKDFKENGDGKTLLEIDTRRIFLDTIEKIFKVADQYSDDIMY